MFLEFLSHLLSLDVGWIFEFIMLNLFWVFAIAALIYIFVGEKKFFLGFLAFTMSVWLWIDFQVISGWIWLIGLFLLIQYVGKFAVMAFAESDPALKNKLIVLNEIQGIGTLIVFNVFLLGVI